MMTKFFNMIEHATRHEYTNVTKTINECFEK